MRIAVLTSLFPNRSFPVEGVFAERRWQVMSGRGHEVSVVHPLPRAPWPFVTGRWAALHAVPPVEERGGIRVEHPRYLHLPRLARRNASAFAGVGVEAVLRRGPAPEVVVCDYAWPAGAAASLLRRRGVPCVVSGRGSDVLQVAGEAGLGADLARALHAAGHWCAVSQHLLGVMDELGGGTGRLVPNGVDLELFHSGDPGDERATLGLERDLPIVLVVGHLIPRKDPLLALASFAAGAPHDARLVFVGEGALRADLERGIASAGLVDRVTLVGAADPERLARWYRAADCLLLTSKREGRPNVVLEALASGLPVVATEAGGTGELLAGLPDALAAGEGARDPKTIGAALARVLASPPAPARLRELVSHLSWEGSAEALESVLREAVEERAA